MALTKLERNFERDRGLVEHLARLPQSLDPSGPLQRGDAAVRDRQSLVARSTRQMWIEAFLHEPDATIEPPDWMRTPPQLSVQFPIGLNLRENGGEAVMPEKLLTIDQAADLLNVRRGFITGLLDQGALPSIGHGSERQIVEAFFLSYRDRRNAERHEAIKRMARADVEAGVYDLVMLPEGATDE